MFLHDLSYTTVIFVYKRRRRRERPGFFFFYSFSPHRQNEVKKYESRENNIYIYI